MLSVLFKGNTTVMNNGQRRSTIHEYFYLFVWFDSDEFHVAVGLACSHPMIEWGELGFIYLELIFTVSFFSFSWIGSTMHNSSHTHTHTHTHPPHLPLHTHTHTHTHTRLTLCQPNSANWRVTEHHCRDIGIVLLAVWLIVKQSTSKFPSSSNGN